MSPPVRQAERASSWPAYFDALAEAGVPLNLLSQAMAIAERVGAEPLDVLAASGAVSEDDLVAALAWTLDVTTLGSGYAPIFHSAIDAETFAAAMISGHLWVGDPDGRPTLVVAARGTAVNALAEVRRDFGDDVRIALASPRVFADLAVRLAGPALADRASQGLASRFPQLTVAHGLPRLHPMLRRAAFATVIVLGALAIVFGQVAIALMTAGGVVFAVMNSFRLWIACTPPSEPDAVRRPDSRSLPVYTILVALAREGAVVPDLLDALEALDYPAAKLDIKLLIEEGDHDTLDALAARPPRFGVEVLELPPGGPKTKPRALNAGLLAARGAFLTVFDAEDRPERGQLREAVAAFRRGSAKLACVQARLAIDNVGDGWLARQFAIEYAALFDVVIPALATLDLPIALGGTSNHFRTEALRSVGGWDPGNVTEDADLGLRLVRLGWKTRTILSTTWEEAPARLWPWIKQRTRWMKGYMVTALIHGRRPRDLARRLDPLSFLASQILIGGVAVTALAYPVVVFEVIRQGVDGTLLAPAESLAGATLAGFHVANLIVGFSAGLACAWVGIDRRRASRLTLDLFTAPFYWLLVGFAAWRAFFQLAFAQTSHWEKTTHGVSRRRATPRQTTPPQM